MVDSIDWYMIVVGFQMLNTYKLLQIVQAEKKKIKRKNKNKNFAQSLV